MVTGRPIGDTLISNGGTTLTCYFERGIVWVDAAKKRYAIDLESR